MRHIPRLVTFALLLSAGAGLAGCSPELTVPAGFVEVDEGYSLYDMRAVSADGVVIALRTEDNPKRGTLAFWAKAVEKEFAARPGYKLVALEKITSATGQAGTLMTFNVIKEATDLTYMIVVYVRPDIVVMVEAGGPSEAVTDIKANLRTAMLSVR